MKKTFHLQHPKIKYPRLVDNVRNEIKRYLKRERNKTLPDGCDVWLFDCKFGASADDAKMVDVAALSQVIGAAEQAQMQSFYIEILAKAGRRQA